MSNLYLEELYKSIISENEGYEFLFCDDIYIPVYRHDLTVTIRETVKLNLLEEKVLQLINAEVYQIDEMSKILGLNRRLLETTIADLHVKNMIAVSAEKCSLLLLGREALNELQIARKTQETLPNVYVDALEGSIITDISCYEFVNNGINNDNKMKVKVEQDDLTIIRDQLPVLNDFFTNYLSSIIGNTQSMKDLLTVDAVENTFVTFIKSSIAVFVSSNGYDIDIQPLNTKKDGMVSRFKDEIIKQIREKRFLLNHFRKKTVNKYNLPEPEAKDFIIEELKNYYYSRKQPSKDDQIIRNAIFSERKLFYGEEEIIIRELSRSAKDVTLIVDNLDDWAYNRQFVGRISGCIGTARLHIVYNSSNNIRKAIEKIKEGSPIIDCTKCNKGHFICWDFDGKFQLYGNPFLKTVINSHTQCLVIDYYLSVVKGRG